MKSIRRRLRVLMFIGMLTTSLIASVLVFSQARHEMNELYDAHLQLIASLLVELPLQNDLSHVRGRFHVSPDQLDDWEEENFLIQIWSKDGHLIYSQPQLDEPYVLPLNARNGRFRARPAGMRWNAYRADGDNYIIQVAQPEQPRRSTVRELCLFLLIPLLVQIPAFAVITSITTRKGLSPLRQLSQALGARHQWALDPLPNEKLPEELRPLVQSLNQLLAQLQVVLDQQRNLLTDAAHELRTPLAALRLQLDAYRRADSDQESEECLISLDRGIVRSSAMVSQLLLFARSEARSFNLPISEMTLEQIATEALERHLPIARAKQIDLGIARLSNARIRIAGGDIEAVIDNLISNAINYSPMGSRVDVSLDAGSDAFILEVADEGRGIPPSERERIFDRFYRVTNAENDGTGLGLAIVQTICERNAAVVTVHDTPSGVGTIFRVNWPLRKE